MKEEADDAARKEPRKLFLSSIRRTNWRIAKLVGNFEGAFLNDNGQSDPSISSLFDSTPGEFNLLGDQFRPGVLNTDRRHIVNAFFSYYLGHSALKGLTIGSGVQFETGIPINDLKVHQFMRTLARSRSTAVAAWAGPRSPVQWTCTWTTDTG